MTVPSRLCRTAMIVLSIGVVLVCGAQVEDEELHFTTSSNEFSATFADTVEALAAKGFDKDLRSPKLGAIPADEFDAVVAEIHRYRPLEGEVEVVKGGHYDVILQPGHYLRTRGRTGASGQLVTEQELMAYLVRPIAQELRQRGITVLVMRADPVIQGSVQGKAFLAIHAEGSQTRCAAKPSLGYERRSTSPMAMHAVGWALGQALGYTYENFAKDNYTPNEASYYMFSRVQTTYMKGLLEVGEITCGPAEKRLIGSASEVSHNIARAITFVIGKQ